MTWHVIDALLVSGTQRLRVLLFVSVLIAMNLFCAWYLSRRTFREFAVQFVAERERELMRIAAEKKTLDEIRRMRK